MGREIAILGAGGFAREVEWLVRETFVGNEKRDFLGYLVSDKSKLGESDSREQVLGDLSWLENNHIDELYVGMGNPTARLKLGREVSKRFPHIKFPWVKHPSVICDDRSIKISRGAIVCAGSVFTVNITIGEFAMINLCCTIGHEGKIGAGCVLNPDVNISGGVVLG